MFGESILKLCKKASKVKQLIMEIAWKNKQVNYKAGEALMNKPTQPGTGKCPSIKARILPQVARI